MTSVFHMIPNNTTFLKELPVKQQLKWCDVLQFPSDEIDWSTIFKKYYYATNETMLRSFQIRLNLRSLLLMFNCMFLILLQIIYTRFVVKKRKLLYIYFVIAKLLMVSGMMYLIGF